MTVGVAVANGVAVAAAVAVVAAAGSGDGGGDIQPKWPLADFMAPHLLPRLYTATAVRYCPLGYVALLTTSRRDVHSDAPLKHYFLVGTDNLLQ